MRRRFSRLDPMAWPEDGAHFIYVGLRLMSIIWRWEVHQSCQMSINCQSTVQQCHGLQIDREFQCSWKRGSPPLAAGLFVNRRSKVYV